MFSIFYLAQETTPASCSPDLVSSVKWVYWMGAREFLEVPTGVGGWRSAPLDWESKLCSQSALYCQLFSIGRC